MASRGRRDCPASGEIISVEAEIDKEHNLSVSANLYNDLAVIKVTAWDDIVEFQTSLADDVCICDPLVKPNPDWPKGLPFDSDLG